MNLKNAILPILTAILIAGCSSSQEKNLTGKPPKDEKLEIARGLLWGCLNPGNYETLRRSCLSDKLSRLGPESRQKAAERWASFLERKGPDYQLLAAVQSEDIEAVEAAIKKGADVNRDFALNGGTSLLEIAQREWNLEVFEVLLREGADPNWRKGPFGRKTDWGTTAFITSQQQGNDTVYGTDFVQKAIDYGYVTTFFSLDTMERTMGQIRDPEQKVRMRRVYNKLKQVSLPQRARIALEFVDTITKKNIDRIGTAERLGFFSKNFLADHDIEVPTVQINRHDITGYEFADISGNYVDIAIQRYPDHVETTSSGQALFHYRFNVVKEGGGYALVPYLFKDGWIHSWHNLRNGAPGFVDPSQPSSGSRVAFAKEFIETRLAEALPVVTNEQRFEFISEEYIERYGIDTETAQFNGFSDIDSYEVLNSFGEFVDIQLIFDNPNIAHQTRVVRLRVIEEGNGLALKPHPLPENPPEYLPYWWVYTNGAYDY